MIKKSLLILSLSLFLISASRGQGSAYNAFPEDSARWNVSDEHYCIFGTRRYECSYVLSGDTLISGQNYHKIYSPPGILYPIWNCYFIFPTEIYQGGMRQDTSAKKVFFVPAHSSVEQLLYDFSMQLGDTVKGYLTLGGQGTHIVQNISYVNTASGLRKSFTIDSTNEVHFIEGVGSDWGLLWILLPGEVINDAGRGRLDCFSVNGNTIYPDAGTACPMINTGGPLPFYTFPVNAGSWNFSHNYSGTKSNAFVNYTIISQGDTNINGQQWGKLYRLPADVHPGTSYYPGDTAHGYAACIRHDTVAKKVYIIAPGETDEELLYDFTLRIGDTIKGYLANPGCLASVVNYIDSVRVGSKYHRRLLIDGNHLIYMIDGVGSTWGLISKLPGTYGPMNETVNLSCFSYNGQTLLPDTNSPCDPILSVPAANLQSIDPYLYPNPGTGLYRLNLPPAFASSVIRVYNIFGQLQGEYSGNTQTLDITALSDGIYYITISNGQQQRMSGKIVKRD